MRIYDGVKFSLSLLNRRAKFMTVAAVVIQILLSILDILGIGAIAALVATSISAIQGNSSSNFVSRISNISFFSHFSLYSIVISFSIFALFCFVLKSILSAYLLKKLMTFLSFRDAEVSTDYTKRFLLSSLANVQSRNSQESIYGLTAGVTASVSGILTNIITIFSESSLLLMVTVTLLMVDFFSTAITFLLFLMTGIIINNLLGRTVSKISSQLSEKTINQFTSLNSNIFAFQEIYAMDRSQYFIEEFTISRWATAKLDSTMRFTQILPRYIFETTLLISGFIVAGFLFVNKNAVGAITGLSVFLAAGLRIMPSIQRLQASFVTIRSNLGMARVFIEMVNDLKLPLSLDSELCSHDDESLTIKVSNVDYSYADSSELVLNSISFNVFKGQSIGIVGKSGSGKSTLLKVLLGLLKPTRGSVTISNKPINEFKKIHPNSFGYVPQDIYLIPGSIRENILFGLDNKKFTDSDIWLALEMAHIAQDLKNLDLDLSSLVGERGINFSGGQRQRIGLARAILANPNFLFLDEATSAMDSKTEFDIVNSIQKLNPDMTKIVIAHRLATVRKMDMIVFIDEGKIVDIGNFEELLKKNRDFANQAKLLGIKN